jgi:hypothetical protein
VQKYEFGFQNHEIQQKKLLIILQILLFSFFRSLNLLSLLAFSFFGAAAEKEKSSNIPLNQGY